MNMVELIRKKKLSQPLTTAEIQYIIEGYTAGSIPDYQMAAWLMAVWFKGMSESETSDLTLAMARSGKMVDLSPIAGIKVDKHSTGGVGDKISLIVAPLVAHVGVPIAKMSGRGLGHTGGTIDKLEAIPGFSTQLTNEQFVTNVNQIKLALIGQSVQLAPADKLIYALRDVTATVDSIPLIASSIMSKKIASGADAIVLDVKVGTGAFMKTVAEARQLAETMVQIGQRLGRNTVAVITDMSQPLGYEVGNASEVREAIEVLAGRGPEDLRTISLTIAAHMAVLGGAYGTYEEAQSQLQAHLDQGSALDTFKQFIIAQGGDPLIVDHPERLPQAGVQTELAATHSGYISAIDAEKIGLAAMLLGAGRQQKDDQIDLAAGITLRKKTGDAVREGESLCVMHSQAVPPATVETILRESFQISSLPPAPVQYIHDMISVHEEGK